MNQGQDIEARIASEIAAIKQSDALGRKAAAAILPGPMKDAFALGQGIPVGRWMVRAFCDIDFEFLAAMDHPLSRLYSDALHGIESKTMFLPTGLPCWQAAWVLTRDPDDVEMVLSQPDGKEILSKAARKEFGKLPTRALAALFAAIMKQIEVSSSTTIEFAAKPEEGEAAKAKENPFS